MCTGCLFYSLWQLNLLICVQQKFCLVVVRCEQMFRCKIRLISMHCCYFIADHNPAVWLQYILFSTSKLLLGWHEGHLVCRSLSHISSKVTLHNKWGRRLIGYQLTNVFPETCNYYKAGGVTTAVHFAVLVPRIF